MWSSGQRQDRQVSEGQTRQPPLPVAPLQTPVCLGSRALQASVSDDEYTQSAAHALQQGLGVRVTVWILLTTADLETGCL